MARENNTGKKVLSSVCVSDYTLITYLLFWLQSQPNTAAGCLYLCNTLPSMVRIMLKSHTIKSNNIMSMSMRTIWLHYMDGLRLVGMLAKTKNGLTKIHLHCMWLFFWNPYDSKQHKKYHSFHAATQFQ